MNPLIREIGEFPDVGNEPQSLMPRRIRTEPHQILRLPTGRKVPTNGIVHIHNVRDFRRKSYSKVKRPSLIRRVLKALS